nr:hypothetical protein [Tanacetum cinerariifolium]
CPFFKAFLVTADVPEIYMHEFWATAYVHQQSIRFKINSKKLLMSLELFKEMLHICLRIHGQSFDELPFEEEILDFIRNTKAYKEYYAFATGEVAPKLKASAKRKRSGSDTSITPPTATTTPKTTVVEKQTANAYFSTGGSGTNEGTGSKPGVPDVPTNESEEELSWNSSDDEGADDQAKDGDDDEGDEGDESDEGEEDADEDRDGDKRDDDKENQETKGGGNDKEEGESDEEDDNEETREEESFDPIPKTPEGSEDEGDGEEDQGLNVNEEEHVEEEEEHELYRDVNINQGRGLQATLEVEDTHVTLTPINSDGMESIFTTASSLVAPLHISTPIMTPSTIATITIISQAQIPPTPIPSEVLQNLPTFASVFCFDERLKSLEANFSEYIQTNPFVEAVSNILGIVHQYMNQQMNEAVRVAVQIPTDRLRDSYQRENDEFLRTIDENMKKIIKEQVKGQVKEQVSKILPRIEQSVNAQLEAERRREDDDDKDEEPSPGSYRGSKRRREGKEPKSASAPLETATRSACRSTTGSKSRQTSASESAFAEEPHSEWFSQPKKPPTPDHDWNKTLPAVQGSTQTWISELAKQSDSRSSFNELLDTPLDFFNFIMNRLRVDTLTPELLAGPTFELMKGSCTSLIELEYHLEEVYKAIMDQLDWVNHEGQQYPHNLLQPLLLIPDNQGRYDIPFAHFINNDLEYLRGGASSRKYTTSVTKTKAADYGNIKWIKDLVPHTMWIHKPIDYDKHALWGVSHWGRKRQQFYGFAVNRESALDVYSKRRIIAVTDLKIMKWHRYKHLDWISVRHDDDKIYKFKEGDFKRLRLQDIKDILLLLVQEKLSNLTVEEHFAFNVSLRMFTRSIVIQRRV